MSKSKKADLAQSSDEDTFSFGSYEDYSIIPEFGPFGPFGPYDEVPKKADSTPNPTRYKQSKKGKKKKKKKKKIKKKIDDGRQMGMKLDYVEPPADGIIRFTEEDWKTVEEAWGICLVGYFDGKFPGKKILTQIQKDWKVESRVRHYRGWLVFNFESKDDLNRVLSGGPYHACGTPLVFKPMPQKMLAFGYERPEITNAEWLL